MENYWVLDKHKALKNTYKNTKTQFNQKRRIGNRKVNPNRHFSPGRKTLV